MGVAFRVMLSTEQRGVIKSYYHQSQSPLLLLLLMLTVLRLSVSIGGGVKFWAIYLISNTGFFPLNWVEKKMGKSRQTINKAKKLTVLF